MRLFPGLCIVGTAIFVIIGAFTVQPVRAGVTQFLCGDGSYSSDCDASWKDGYKCQDGAVVSTQGGCSGHGGPVSRLEPLCGDGVGDIGEQCDQGSQNSDNLPNACRTDCRTAYCGDGVVDNGELCDDGQASYYPLSHPNASTTPNSCRNGCKLPVCGDGIADSAYNEECDDGNNNDLDGCKKDCTTCLQLSNNIDVTTDTKLCGQVFNVADYGNEGVLIAKFPGVTIDCDGATLQGSGVGTGIYIKMSNNVTLKNCTVTGYAIGIKVVDSQNFNFAGYGNNIFGNTQKFVLENSQLAPPKPMTSVVSGSMVGGNKPITKLNQPQSQTPGKFQPGVAPQSRVKSGGDSRRFKLPVRQPKPGQPFPPRGTKSIGGKTVGGLSPAPPAPLGRKSVSPAPLGSKSMPIDPLGKGSMPPDPLDTKKMPVDPYGTKSMPIDPFGNKSLPVDPLETPQIQMGR